MSTKSNDTRDEHYIPIMYLKGFSEIKGKSNKEKVLLWQFRTSTKEHIAVPVNARTICFEKDLYELTSQDGTFIAQNIIENRLSQFEAKVAGVIRCIQERSKNEDCFYCPHVLNDEEKSILIIFMTLLIYRDPKTIKRGATFLEKSQGMNADEARNYTLLNLLPLGIDSDWDENTLIIEATKHLCGMTFQIGVAPDDCIITCDRPVIEWKPYENELYGRPRAVVFPLTSRLVLYMYPIETVPTGDHCFFFKMDEKQIEDVQYNVVVSSREWIYSKKPFEGKLLENIKKAIALDTGSE